MAIVGLSRPYYAVYSNSGSTVTYANGGRLGKYTEMSIDLDNADENILYADKAPAESVVEFTGGTMSITTDDLNPAAMEKVLGVETETINAAGLTTANAKWMEFNDDQNVPYLGVGGIIKRIVGGATKWQAFILNKVRLNNPSQAVTTQGATIEWQTSNLTAQILRSDAAKHPWRKLSSYLDSEEDAALVIRSFLNITED